MGHLLGKDRRDVDFCGCSYRQKRYNLDYFGPICQAATADTEKPRQYYSDGAFHGLNRLRIVASEAEVVRVMLEVASSRLSEDDLAAWLREHTEHR